MTISLHGSETLKLAWFALLFSSVLAAQTPSWRLVVDNFPPYIDEMSEERGALSQVVMAVLAQENIQAQVEIVPWQHIATEAAKPNSASYFWFETPDLQQQWYFSEAITSVQQVFLVRKESGIQLARLDQLRGLKVGVTKNYFYGERFASIAPQLQLTTATSDFSNLQALINREIDVAIMDPVIAHVMMQQLAKSAAEQIRFLDAPALTSRPVYLVCTRNFIPCLEFVQKFNHGLAAFKAKQLHRPILGSGVRE